HLELLIWKDLRDDFVDTELTRHRLRCCATVSGQHDDTNAFLMERAYRFRRARLDGISHAQETGERSADRKERYRGAFRPQQIRLVDRLADAHAQTRHNR